MAKSKKKSAIELTNTETVRRLFGKPLRDALKKIARLKGKR